MKKKDFEVIMEELCPHDLAESWDNCGYQLNTGKQDIYTVMTALEVTGEVIDEAANEGADIIVTHHPMLFNPVRCVDYNNFIGNYIFRLAEAGISVFSCHTNFDKVTGGNNDYFGRLMEFENVRPFDSDNGFCRKGETPFDTTLLEIIHKASEKLMIDEKFFRFEGNLSDIINKVGWCTGAGSEFILDAFNEGCDLYITGDLKYHEAQMAKETGIPVLDVGHYGSEKIFAENMADLLRDRLPSDVAIIESSIDINPFG